MRQQETLEEILMDKANNDGRGRDRSTDDIDFMEAICDARGPAAGTAEIAEIVEMTRQGASHRLNQLEAKGVVRSKDAGGVTIWWPDSYPLESDD
jgi:DNA-binding MarR family transcriptional regulator